MTRDLVSAVTVVGNICQLPHEVRSWDVIRKALTKVENATANNDYTAAIRCFDEWESLLLAGKNCSLNFRDHCEHRLKKDVRGH